MSRWIITLLVRPFLPCSGASARTSMPGVGPSSKVTHMTLGRSEGFAHQAQRLIAETSSFREVATSK
jgi:hypothetical protein